MITGKKKKSESKLYQNMWKSNLQNSSREVLFLTLFMLFCWVVWMCTHYLLAKNHYNRQAFNTSSGGHSQAQTNVLSRISSNSCWEEPTEIRSSTALLVMVQCLPSASDRSEAFWFNLQSESTPQGPEPRSLWCTFTKSIPLLTHVVVLQIIDSLYDMSAYLTVAFLLFGDISVVKERQHWEDERGRLRFGNVWFTRFYMNVMKYLDFWIFQVFDSLD